MPIPQPTDVPPIDDWGQLLAGRVAIVTGGGADGIGGATARLLAEHGAAVEIADVDNERSERTRAAIAARGGVARAHQVDVCSAQQAAGFVEAVLAQHRRIDVLVNNVGDYRPAVRFDASGPDDWYHQFEINLKHVFQMTRAVLPTMITQRRGSIVNVHSVEGLRGYPGDPVYAAMKAGVAHFTTSLAVAYGRRGIRVNAIGPDMTQTAQVDYLSASADAPDLWPSWDPVGRLGWPEDQARVVLFLASDMSAFVTGHNIPVDGGTRAGGGWYYSPAMRHFTAQPRHL